MSPEFDKFTAEFDLASIRVTAQFAGQVAVASAAENRPTPETNTRHVETREYQIEAWHHLAEARRSGESRALVHLATGLGKTTVAAIDALRFIEEHNEGRDVFNMPKILFACHQNSILEQAAERFSQFAPDIPQGFFNGDNRELDAPLTFATMQSLHQNIDSLDPSAFDYIIYDEAHHSQAKTFSKVVGHFSPAFQLALTATPDRMDGKNIRDLFGKEIYKKTLEEAMGEGWLADVDYHIVFDEAVKNVLEQDFNPQTLKELYELFNNQSRNQAIADQIQDEMERIGLEHAKTIVFCQDIEQANEMAELLGGQAYHSGMQDDLQKKVLDSFRSNGLQVITTRDMFNEGVDVPDARLLIFLRSTGSKTIFEQQLGRGLRKHPGKDKVSVLDFVANIERLSLIKELVEGLSGRPNTAAGDGRDKATQPERLERGLSIHTIHGDFDFDRISVILLDKLDRLSRNNRPDWSQHNEASLVERALALSPDQPLRQIQIAQFSKDGLFPSTATISKVFGSLKEFHARCGFAPAEKWERKTDDEILAEVNKALEGTEKHFQKTYLEAAKGGKLPSVPTLKKRFGSFKNVLTAIGRDEPIDRMSNDELANLAAEISPDKPLKQRDIELLSKNGQFVSWPTVKSRFGSVQAFYDAVGWEYIVPLSKLTPQEIIERMLEVSPDKPLTKTQIEELSSQGMLPSYITIVKKFGSTIKDVHRACGFER